MKTEKKEAQKILKEKVIQEQLSKKQKKEKNKIKNRKSKKNNKSTQTIALIEELEVIYKEGNLEILNKELRRYSYDCEYLQLSFIDLKD